MEGLTADPEPRSISPKRVSRHVRGATKLTHKSTQAVSLPVSIRYLNHAGRQAAQMMLIRCIEINCRTPSRR